ncbi:f71c4f7f-7968-4ec0-9193-f2a8326cebc5 [Thermothielavioides terrestris]|uniref:Uncharacterized protein n=2 Tax=Thermothielavioides terrestris TaxID=2587410 RepID=G2RC47_THETT|nr:uncharacterized protein THITE_2119689 [Thermothielavioides terrestris NRRL 8126]AEO69368.1 hypothetical protein THITE_2119689 [Thermothielavioides terrestris NRRL 8126]SPQ22364.1 f71c4f7f-7968-4ec0-9193-f2a8326cebc5 [Thermothielavioides terrestris]
MATASFAAVSRADTQPLPTRDIPTSHTRSNNSSFSGDDGILHHTNRQTRSSIKAPASRFADLRKDRLSLPSLLQRTPLSPVLSQTAAGPLDGQPAHEQTHRIPGSSQNGLHHSSSAHTLPPRPELFETQQTGGATKTRSLKFHLPSTALAAPAAPADPSSTGSKRPASFPPETPRAIDSPAAARPRLSYDAIPAAKHRLTEGAAKEAAQGQRELLLPKTLQTSTTPTTKTDDKKSRPPVSYRPPNGANTTGTTSPGRAVIPPIRSFRSSGSRRSSVLDSRTRRASEESSKESAPEPNQRDHALQALEGRGDKDFSRSTPSESGEMTTTTDNDNTADIFMKIAREEPALRALEKLPPAPAAETSTISRIVRTSSHRRPLSTSIPSHEASEPPHPRRLSDQRDDSRTRQATDSQTAQQLTRELAYSTTTRENLPPIATTVEGSSRTQPSRTPLRPSPITPRQISFKDAFAESSSAYQRRRQSLTEGSSLSGSRSSQYRNPNLAVTQSRTYHSSPLVPKSANLQADGPQHGSDANHGVEGTESSSSTAAPSTVWDELDDLKSRIHRLELSGKMPSIAGSTAPRSSDERPRTATTNATTMSASPRQGSGTGAAQANGNKSPSAPRETQPLLLSALGKTRDAVSSDVFSAIESAATEALALSSLIGPAGQPGPISSGASAIGGYNGNVTDRQLRKKADSIIRSLTELCLALADPASQNKKHQPATAPPEPELLLSPSSGKATAGALTPQRRPSAVADVIAKASTSPRAPTALEQKRKTMLAGISLPSSRYATAPSTPLEPTAGRKSSLLLARIRRAATEEPEETLQQTGRRSSLLLRTRRSGDEEQPEETREGQKTSLLLRTRKTMNEEDEPRSRVPSRAITEINSFHAIPRDLALTALAGHPAPESNAAAASLPLPRRRLIPSAISTRLASTVAPAASTPLTPARKYLERGTLQDRGSYLERGAHQERGSYLERSAHQERGPINAVSEKLAEERGQQQQQNQLSLGQTPTVSRTGSFGRRTRESSIPSLRS